MCSACLRLIYPILIKKERKFDEFEKLHYQYLEMNVDHTAMKNGQDSGELLLNHNEMEKVNNIKIIFI